MCALYIDVYFTPIFTVYTVLLEKKWFKGNVYGQMDRQMMDDLQQMIIIAHLS